MKGGHHARGVRKWVIQVGRQGFLLSIFFHLLTNFPKRLWKFLYEVQKKNKQQQNTKKKNKIVQGLIAKQLCLSKHFYCKVN